MGNYMSAQGFVITGILLAGFLGFIVGVPSYQMVYVPRTANNPNPSFSYFGICDDINQNTQHCHGLTLDFIHCQNGDAPAVLSGVPSSYNYDPFFTDKALSPFIDTNPAPGTNFLDVATCRSMIAAEAFGIMAVIFSFIGLLGALVHEKGRMGGGAAAVLASVLGVITLAIFFAAKPEILNNSLGLPSQNKSIADFVNNGFLHMGYSTGLQIVGIIASFFGGMLALAGGDFGPSGGLTMNNNRASHHPQSSTAGTEMTR